MFASFQPQKQFTAGPPTPGTHLQAIAQSPQLARPVPGCCPPISSEEIIVRGPEYGAIPSCAQPSPGNVSSDVNCKTALARGLFLHPRGSLRTLFAHGCPKRRGTTGLRPRPPGTAVFCPAPVLPEWTDCATAASCHRCLSASGLRECCLRSVFRRRQQSLRMNGCSGGGQKQWLLGKTVRQHLELLSCLSPASKTPSPGPA